MMTLSKKVLLPILALLLVAGPLSAQAQDEWTGVERIVAIGDVHGDYGRFVKLLGQAGLIDDRP